jgi:hypothetical protein
LVLAHIQPKAAMRPSHKAVVPSLSDMKVPRNP